MLNVVTVSKALELLKQHFENTLERTEYVELSLAQGRVLAQDAVASENIPGFDRSTVDGYAVIASDTFGCSEALPAMLRNIGEVLMGKDFGISVSQGEAVYIPTGGALPNNANAVVMVEYTEDLKDGEVLIQKSAAPGDNIIYADDDIKCGKISIKAGTRLDTRHIGILAALGYKSVPVKSKVRVAIISTGDEVIPIDAPIEPGKVRDVNSYITEALLIKAGAEVHRIGIVQDDIDALRNAVKGAMEEHDLILISGGSSAGTRDITLDVLDSLGKRGSFVHGLLLKPGKPTILADLNGKAAIGLPGHPLSAFVVIKLVVIPLLSILQGVEEKDPDYKIATLSKDVPSNHGREEILPVSCAFINGELYAEPLFGKSGLISTLSKSEGFIRIEGSVEGIIAEEKVKVFPW